MTVTFNHMKVIYFLCFILFSAFGLWCALTSFDPAMPGRAWVGGLFNGVGMVFWWFFLTEYNPPSSISPQRGNK